MNSTAATRIEYTKVFLTGNLAGLAVRCGYSVPDADVSRHMALLSRITKSTPSQDLQGSDFWVSNLGCIDAHEAARDAAAGRPCEVAR